MGESLYTELDTLEALMHLAEDHNLKRLKIGEFEIEFFESRPLPVQGVADELKYDFDDDRSDDFYSGI